MIAFLVFVNYRNSEVPNVLAADDISDIQDDISSTQDKIEKYQQQLEQDQTLLGRNQIQVSNTKKLIADAEASITRKEAELENLKQRIGLQKSLLQEYIRNLYYYDQEDPLVVLASGNRNLGEIAANFDQEINIKEKILSTLAEIKQSNDQTEQTKSQLEETQADHEKLLGVKLMEQTDLKEQVQDTQTTINQLSSKLSELRSQYSRALGKTVSTNDILKAADFAAKATGMSKSFLLGVLIQESNKGQSVGGCDYKSSRMTSTQLTAFKSITKELGYDYKKQKVSCPSSSYKGTGGAMGVPQFMPTTWLGYKSTIAGYSGNNPPDPWNLVDGVVAMAAKLSNDGASKKTRFAEAKSYCVYLAGGNWGYYCFGSDKYKKDYEDVNCWGSSIKNYGEKVLCLKDNYEKYYK